MSESPNQVVRERTLLAYADESGNVGAIDNGGTVTYSIGVVLVEVHRWPEVFESFVLLRRRLKDKFGLPIRAEIKANYLVRGHGTLSKLRLSPAERRLIYRAHLLQTAASGLRAFGVVIDKRQLSKDADPRLLAWQTVLERLERTSTKEGCPFLLLHDEGENEIVRKIARRARRHMPVPSAYGGAGRILNASLLLDDPIPRSSHQSYLIQLSDLVAYAAFRAIVPPSPAIAQVVPSGMWAQLGEAIHTPVNSLSGGVPGVVRRSK